eukprot:TRINITY_DN80247_c0_g1_i1.p1 TRINITY_DN80247_c0_g1~~TRINITY_DN80247_c0_g1_i1.p1  ORF type:complete len:761 (-),score=95.39 TRINITY_DN80247_c0_g1_i1:81-2363(-)
MIAFNAPVEAPPGPRPPCMPAFPCRQGSRRRSASQQVPVPKLRLAPDGRPGTGEHFRDFEVPLAAPSLPRATCKRPFSARTQRARPEVCRSPQSARKVAAPAPTPAPAATQPDDSPGPQDAAPWRPRSARLSRFSTDVHDFKLSPNILMQTFRYVPVVALLPLRRVCKCFYSCAQLFLSRNPGSKVDLEAEMALMLNGREDQRVWVAVRARPYFLTEGCCDIYRNRVTLASSQRSARGGEGDLQFYFDAAFHWDSTQNEVWSRIQPRLMRCTMRREHACLLAYGQTGSGKTHTMFGEPSTPGSEGIAFRVARSLDAMLQNWKGPEPPPAIELSFLEVYNEQVYDLFADRQECPVVSRREILKAGSKYCAAVYSDAERAVPQGLTRRRCRSCHVEKEVWGWLAEGFSARTAGQTVCNARSSRSHAVVTMHVVWHQKTQEADQEAASLPEPDAREETRLYLVDLAGSERAGKYALTLQQLREGVNINRSLSTLARVVGALARGQGEHVPHRDSTLTWLLHDAITGRSARAFMIATVHPEHPAETLSTLCYAREYSALRSDLNRRIAKTLTEVRRLRSRMAAVHSEFSRACADYASKCRGAPIWTADTLNEERVVRARHGAPKDFKSHPHLIWTDAHWGKRSIGAVGVVREVVDMPTPRSQGEAKDGRRRRPRTSDSEEGDVVPSVLPGGRAVKVSYAGRHGWPALELWYPESALADVPPPAHLLELVHRSEQLEALLQGKQQQLQEVREELVAQQEQWMANA